MRRTEHGDSPDLAAIEQLTRNHGCLNRLANSDIVFYQEPNRIQLERHHQWDELIRPGLGGNSPETAERPRGSAVDSRAASRSSWPEAKSPRSSRLGNENATD